VARYSAGVRTGAGSTTLPIISLYSGSAVNGAIVEIGVFNTTAVAVALKLIRLTTAGTASGLTETSHEAIAAAASCGAVGTHSSTGPTLGGDLGYYVTLGPFVGAGVIWTFGGMGLSTGLSGTGNGVGVIVATGTGQVCDAYMVWEE
jgi:hypothetical protein